MLNDKTSFVDFLSEAGRASRNCPVDGAHRVLKLYGGTEEGLRVAEGLNQFYFGIKTSAGETHAWVHCKSPLLPSKDYEWWQNFDDEFQAARLVFAVIGEVRRSLLRMRALKCNVCKKCTACDI